MARFQLLSEPKPVTSRPLALVEREAPEPAPNEVTIDVTACAICRTDLQLAEGDLTARRLPVVPGHQAVGRVRAVGDAVDGWAPGDRVGAAWLASTCGTCRWCRSGRENLCETAQYHGWDRDGGYADVMTADANFVFALPASFSDLQAAPLLCGGVIGFRALRIAGIEPGGRLGLYGFGASASLAIQVAVHWDCDVFVATRSRREQQRALAMGAVWAGSYHEVPPVALDAAVTFAPAGFVVVEALKAVAPGGTVAINAIHLDSIPEFPYHLLWMERGLRSVANFTREDAREFLELAASIPIEVTTESYPLADADIALNRLKRGDTKGTAVLVP